MRQLIKGNNLFFLELFDFIALLNCFEHNKDNNINTLTRTNFLVHILKMNTARENTRQKC